MTRPAKTALALGKIDLEEKTTDLRLKLKGKLAVDLADYQRAFAQANDQSLELDQLVPHILAAFMINNGGGIFNADRKPDCVTPENIEAMDYVLAVNPRRAFGTHDMTLSVAGKTMHRQRLQWATEQGGGEFSVLEPGESLDI